MDRSYKPQIFYFVSRGRRGKGQQLWGFKQPDGLGEETVIESGGPAIHIAVLSAE